MSYPAPVRPAFTAPPATTPGRRRGAAVSAVKTALLLSALSALLLLAGRAVGGTGGLVVAAFLAVVMNGSTYFFSDRLALRAMNARALRDGELPQLRRIVDELSASRGLPVPKIYVSSAPTPNAFATGRNPQHAAVCVTEELLGMLDERELRGVLAHELSHVKHRDILIGTIAAAIATAVMVLANLAQFAAFFGVGRSDDEDGPGLIGMLLLILVGPVAASLIQLAVTRSREYEADAGGAALTGDPLGLASALVKIEAAATARPLPESAAAGPLSALMIANPPRRSGMSRLFSTHPSTADRVQRLQAMVAASGAGGSLSRVS